jgi:N-acetyl-gamma-glutamyl-phosphate reductase
VIDAKSGVSGAGRGAAESMEVVKSNQDSKAYKVGAHRHTPEIAQELAALAAGAGSANGALPVTFVPHLMPFDQGELVSCYVRTARPVGEAEALELYGSASAYGDEPFVRLTDEPPGVAEVRGTNLCLVHVVADPDSSRVLAFAAIDNLWKGAASQAVQNLNLVLGLPEGEGIT